MFSNRLKSDFSMGSRNEQLDDRPSTDPPSADQFPCLSMADNPDVLRAFMTVPGTRTADMMRITDDVSAIDEEDPIDEAAIDFCARMLDTNGATRAEIAEVLRGSPMFDEAQDIMLQFLAAQGELPNPANGDYKKIRRSPHAR